MSVLRRRTYKHNLPFNKYLHIDSVNNNEALLFHLKDLRKQVLGSAFTLAFWFKSDASTDAYILNARLSGGQGTQVSLDSSGNIFFITNSSFGQSRFNTNINGRKWNHITIIQTKNEDGTWQLKHFINSVFATSTAVPNNFWEEQITRFQFGSTYDFKGLFDLGDLVIVNRALTTDEIKGLRDYSVTSEINPDIAFHLEVGEEFSKDLLCEKSGGADGTWDAGAISLNPVADGDAIKVDLFQKYAVNPFAGFDQSWISPDFKDYDFAINPFSGSTGSTALRIFETGSTKYNVSGYSVSDNFEVQLSGGSVIYKHNDAIIRTTPAPADSLFVKIGMPEPGNFYSFDLNGGRFSLTNITNLRITDKAIKSKHNQYNALPNLRSYLYRFNNFTNSIKML